MPHPPILPRNKTSRPFAQLTCPDDPTVDTYIRKTTPRFPADSGSFGKGDRAFIRARREDARGQIQEEAARRKIPGDDFHEVVDSHARLVRGRHVPAWWTRAVSVAARCAAR